LQQQQQLLLLQLLLNNYNNPTTMIFNNMKSVTRCEISDISGEMDWVVLAWAVRSNYRSSEFWDTGRGRPK